VGGRLQAALKRRSDSSARKQKARGVTRDARDPNASTGDDVTRDSRGGFGYPTGPDLTGSIRTTFDRFCGALSQRLGIIGKGGYGLGRPTGGKLPEAIRAVDHGVECLGFEAAVDACFEYAESSGTKPESIGFFVRYLARLEPPPKQRGPGECPQPGDPDFNEAAAWPSMQKFFMRDAGASRRHSA